MMYEDPGWRGVLGRVGGAIFRPGKASHSGEGLNGVSTLRAMFLAFVLPLPMYLYVVFAIVEGEGEPLQTWAVSAIVLAGVLAIVGARWAATRPLATSSEQELASSFRRNFLIGIAFAEGPMLLGLVLALVERSRRPFLVGLAFTLVGLWIVAPTRGQIERRQRDVTAAGSPLSLGEALSRSYPRSEP